MIIIVHRIVLFTSFATSSNIITTFGMWQKVQEYLLLLSEHIIFLAFVQNVAVMYVHIANS